DVVWSVAFSPDGCLALTGSGCRITNRKWDPGSDFTVRLWEVATGRQLNCFETREAGQVVQVAFSPDGRHVLGTNKDWALRKSALRTGQELPGISGVSHRPFLMAAFARDGSRILTSRQDRSVCLWGDEQDSAVATFEAHAEAVLCAAFSPDGH